MKINKYTRIFGLKETDELKNTVYDGDLWRKYRDRQNAMARARRKDKLNENKFEKHPYNHSGHICSAKLFSLERHKYGAGSYAAKPRDIWFTYVCILCLLGHWSHSFSGNGFYTFPI